MTITNDIKYIGVDDKDIDLLTAIKKQHLRIGVI